LKDIDLYFWVSELPELHTLLAWLESVGAEQIRYAADVQKRTSLEIVCRYQETWLDLSWQTFANMEASLKRLYTGESTARLDLVQAGNLLRARPIRSHGWLEKWQPRLKEFPSTLQKGVILTAAEFWRYPHHIEGLWSLARREAYLGLTEWLLADVQDGLRILFAVNHTWEPDWKQLAYAAARLEQAPDDLVRRINHIWQTAEPGQRVRQTLELLLEILYMVPESIDVGASILNIQQSLAVHAPQPVRGKGLYPQFTRLETPRLVVRRFMESDAATLMAYRNDPQVALYQDWRDLTPEAARAFIQDLHHLEPGMPGEWFQFALEVGDTGVHVGDIGLHVFADEPLQAEIGVTVAYPYQGMGYAREAMQAVLAYCFEVLQLHRVTATIDTRNQPSIRLMERLGFRREGHYKQSYRDVDRWTDEYLYARLRSEWQAQQDESGGARGG
ncbi:MAG: GNAT family N-acetyltransferase, partial [Anaerolineales bacterium]